jgi:hypothetical protein
MSVFGPRPPAKLQTAVNHAERLCEVLSRFEVSEWPRDDPGSAWLVGRCEAIEKVVMRTVGDWRANARTENAATRALVAYVNELHASVREHFGLETVLECCFSDAVATTPLVREDTSTCLMVVPRTPAGDTIAHSPGGLGFAGRKP